MQREHRNETYPFEISTGIVDPLFPAVASRGPGRPLGTSDFTIAFWFKVPPITNLMDLLGDRVNIADGNFVQIRMGGNGGVGVELDQDTSGATYQGVASGPGYDVRSGTTSPSGARA
jgi:hypothetical protein